MTNLQGPSSDPSAWARPGDQGPFDQPAGAEPRPYETAQDHAPEHTEPHAAAPTGPDGAGPPPRHTPVGGRTSTPGTSKTEPAAVKTKRGFHRDPLTVFLALIIVVSLVVAGLIGSELYARHVANSKVAQVVTCEINDQATASFGVTPLLLWQLATRHFTNISVETAGNQIRDAKGMKVKIAIHNVRLKSTPTSKGTVGTLDATITWSAEGIKHSVQDALPVLGPLVTSNVVTHPKDGTIEFKGMLSNIIAKPVVAGNGLQLQIINFNTLGFSMPREIVQATLNDFTNNLTKNYPLGIHADSVQVTSTGVVSHFSTRNASLPTGHDGQDTCFSRL